MITSYPEMSQLTVNELLALTLRESPDSELVKELTARFSAPNMLVSATVEELTEIPGIGPRKAAQFLASIELGKRLHATPLHRPEIIRSPADVTAMLMGEMKFLDREHFRVLTLDTKNKLISIENVSVGSLSSAIVHPREVFLSAIRRRAASIIAVHNHPSGDPTPSREDVDVTRRLVEAGRLLGIDVLDHIVIGDSRWTSLKESGQM